LRGRMRRLGEARKDGGRGARGGGEKEAGRDGLVREVGFQDPDVPDRGQAHQVDRQLGLGEKMANRAVIGLNVCSSDVDANMIRVRPGGKPRPVIRPRHRMKARSAQHHRRVKRDQGRDQKLACEPRHVDQKS
jgi:hypothetical protein